MMFGIGTSEMLILAVIALLLFGKRLPEVARSLGKGMMEFKKGLYDIQDEVMSPGTNRTTAAPQSRPIASDVRDEAIAPKFEPPKFEPGEVAPEQPA
jgi:sec-independent protein translocase protein TatA